MSEQDKVRTLLGTIKSSLQHLYNREQDFGRQLIISNTIKMLNEVNSMLIKQPNK